MNKKHRVKSSSVQSYLSLLMFAIILFSICFVALINWLFLDKYYLYKAKKNYENAYREIKEISENIEVSSEDYYYALEELAKKVNKQYNASVLIVYSGEKNIRYISYGINDYYRAINRLSDYKKGHIYGLKRVISSNAERILQISEDTLPSADKINILESWGSVNSSTSFLMFSVISNMKNAAEISTQFLFFIGLLVSSVSTVVAFFSAKYFSKPIKDLNNATKMMAHMDFSCKFNKVSYKEINELGLNINYMSDCIQKAIKKLKETNIKLQSDIEKYEDIEKMRSEFISSVSHELKTPLALIMGYAEGLKMCISENSIEDKDFYCDVIIDESNRMNAMVKNLLLLNELEYRKPEYTVEEFDIVEFIKNVVNSYHIMLKQKEITVNIKCEDSIIIFTDASKIEMVIRNFFINAINHVDGNKLIEINFNILDNGDVRVGVFNTGNKISEEDIERIWDKFYKVDKARTHQYGGNGIGLSIVKAVLDYTKKPFGCINRDNGVEFYFHLDTEKSLRNQ